MFEQIENTDYQYISKCTECNWHDTPTILGIPWNGNKICPECGSKIEKKIGKFKYSKKIKGNFIKKIKWSFKVIWKDDEVKNRKDDEVKNRKDDSGCQHKRKKLVPGLYVDDVVCVDCNKLLL